LPAQGLGEWPARRCRRTLSEEILLETINLMHPLVEDRDNTDIAIRQVPPIHEMPLVPEEIPFHPNSAGTARECTPRVSICSNAANKPVM
jgi:hypothetical protein